MFRAAKGDPLAKYASEIAKINSNADEIAALSDDAIKAEVEKYKTELNQIQDTEKKIKKLAIIK